MTLVRIARRPLWLTLLLLAACTEKGELEAPRERYNDALEDFRAESWQEAADGFLEARDEARLDPELRYRAAFNLGMSHAHLAEAAEKEDPQKAIDSLRTSASWFQDALRRRPDDEDARVNLEIVLRRAQLLADKLNQGANGLEARLDRVIQDQRSLLDSIRKLLSRVEQAGAAAEPVGFESDFDELATFERTLLSDTGVVTDLAGDELDLIKNRTDDQRSDQDRVRMVQLTNLEQYLQTARTSLADTRRLLRHLQGDKAHDRADAALSDLKRAREQLQDPVSVLKGIASDQTMLLMHTSALRELRGGNIELDGGEPAKAPPWLTSSHLRERQDDLAQRAAEIQARFSAGVDTADKDASKVPDDPKAQRMLAAAREALPHLQQAVADMQGASSALAADRLAAAAEKQTAALDALFSAIERFAGLRDLIELTYHDQVQLVALLTPPDVTPESSAVAQAAADPKLRELPTAKRTQRIGEILGRNRDRLERLKGLIEDEVTAAEKQAAQQQQQAAAAGGQTAAGGQDAGVPPGSQEASQQLEAAKERLRMAEELRSQALDALTELGEELANPRARRAGAEGGPLEKASTALDRVEQLRRLFFTIVEHLKELYRNQTETHDKTATAQAADDEDRGPLLGPLADFQQKHAALGEALASALEEQADAAAASSEPQAQKASQALADAAVEMRDGHTEMADAAAALAEARDQALSYDLQPTLDHQMTALEHIENAIHLLEPQQQKQNQQQKKQQQNQDQNQQQKQGQQKQKKSDESQKQVSQQQAQRRLQAIREREAERERKRRNAQRMKPEPVEKDW